MALFTCSGCGKLLKAWGSHKNACPKDRSLALQLIPLPADPDTTVPPVPVPPDQAPVAVGLDDLLAARRSTRIVKRIPRAVRTYASETLAKCIEQFVKDPTPANWTSLLMFASCSFHTDGPSGSAKQESLSARFRHQLKLFESGIRPDFSVPPARPTRPGRSIPNNNQENLRRTVESFVDDCNITGAVARLSSEESVLQVDEKVLISLKDKHPPEPPDLKLPKAPEAGATVFTHVSPEETMQAVFSFPSGSAGGLDGLRPQHMKDMLNCKDAVQSSLCVALTKFANFLLSGKAPEFSRGILFGANLIALRKKDGGIRPIAVGLFYRRLVSKTVAKRCAGKARDLFSPVQVGCGIKGGAEAAVHAVRSFLEQEHPGPRVLFKIDFKNAFNTVRRDVMLQTALDTFPEYFPYIWSAYSAPSVLNCGTSGHLLSSATGIQQGDPLGPLLYCLAAQTLSSNLTSELHVFYLDDGALAGTVDTVTADVEAITRESARVGLELNPTKCEMYIVGGSTAEREDIRNRLHTVAPGAIVLGPEMVKFLGAPLTDECLTVCMEEKVAALKLLLGRLMCISSHHAFFLLRNCLAIPKLQYLLRCSPYWKVPACLDEFDELVRIALETITNTRLEGAAYIQSTLPVSRGGLGVRRAKTLASSAFLGSVFSTRKLTSEIYRGDSEDLVAGATAVWKQESGCEEAPLELARIHQRVWDNAVLSRDVIRLWDATGNNERSVARLRAVGTKYAGSWLNALPSKKFGNWLDDQSFRISVGVWLGAKIVELHGCDNCGKEVTEDGLHGLSCRKSAGLWKSRHNCVNDVVLRSLRNAGVESYPEPAGYVREDGKRPDGATRINWFRGQPLVWDVTICDTVCDSYVGDTSKCAGAAAEQAWAKKNWKYRTIVDRCCFVPLAGESLGTWCKAAVLLFKEIGRRLFLNTGECRATCFLFQRLSLEIMRGNAQLITSTVPCRADWTKFFI